MRLTCFIAGALLSICVCAANSPFVQKESELDKAYMECQYAFSYAKDTLKPDIRKSDRMLLYIGKNASKFYSYSTFLADSALKADIAAKIPQAQLMANIAKYKGGEPDIIYKTPDKVTVTSKIAKDYYKMEESVPEFNWAIAEDAPGNSAVILGYNCRKATCSFRGRNYIAWFTPGIPVSNGPWKFSGLPGLIVKIQDDANHYNWELVGIKSVKELPILFDERQYINTSGERFAKTQQRFNDDPIGFLSGTGVKVTVTGPDGKPMSAADLKKTKVQIVSGDSYSETSGGALGGYDPIERIR